MRQYPDPRIDLELALLKLSHPKLQTDSEVVLSRLERIERHLQELDGPFISNSLPADETTSDIEKEDASPLPDQNTSSVKKVDPIEENLPSLQEVESVWPDIKKSLSGKGKARFSGGRFISVDTDGVVFSLPNEIHRDRCAECLSEVEESLSEKLHRKTRVNLVVDSGGAETMQQQERQTSTTINKDEDLDLDSLDDAEATAGDGLSLVVDSFPGAKIVDDE